MTTINSGDPVEVKKVWARGEGLWFRDYVFIRYDGADALVQPTRGLFKGCVARYPAEEVRASSL